MGLKIHVGLIGGSVEPKAKKLVSFKSVSMKALLKGLLLLCVISNSNCRQADGVRNPERNCALIVEIGAIHHSLPL